MPRFAPLLVLLLSVSASAQNVDLVLTPNSGFHDAVTPGLPFHFFQSFQNRSEASATGVTLTITSPGAIVKAPGNCVVNGGRAVCAIGNVAPRAFAFEQFEILAPDISEAPFEVIAEVSANEADPNPADNRLATRGRTFRTFFVTSTADADSGSLRAAIEGANATCNSVYPCLIAFRIAVTNQQWHTIRVESPLPRVIAAQLQIDGSTQSAYFGDTNPAGPEIEITGTPAAGNGIEMAVPCHAWINDLAINGFPGTGLLLLSSFHCNSFFRVVRANYIGTDPTGTRAIPNERGVTVATSADALPYAIDHNLISGNRRSGIFVDTASAVAITRNIIGLNRDVTAGLGNGASGIYVGTARGVAIDDNFIGFNEHFGVAISRGTTIVSLHGNSFQANYQTAIDYDLDGLPTQHPIAIPEITSVRFENGETIVEGLADHAVSIYANDAPDPSGYGEGQYYLGTASSNAGRFTFRRTGDWRGKWFAATQTRSVFETLIDGSKVLLSTTTSEFSRAMAH